jgi:hypothetical protein
MGKVLVCGHNSFEINAFQAPFLKDTTINKNVLIFECS